MLGFQPRKFEYYSHVGATTGGLVAAPTHDNQIAVTDFIITVSTTSEVTLKWYLPAGIDDPFPYNVSDTFFGPHTLGEGIAHSFHQVFVLPKGAQIWIVSTAGTVECSCYYYEG